MVSTAGFQPARVGSIPASPICLYLFIHGYTFSIDDIMERMYTLQMLS